jgi:hypothetical protein
VGRRRPGCSAGTDPVDLRRTSQSRPPAAAQGSIAADDADNRLVHEVYLRSHHQFRGQFQNKSHFIAICALLMRQILVGYERDKRALCSQGRLKIQRRPRYHQHLHAANQTTARNYMIFP